MTVDARWIRTPDDRAAIDEGCTFDDGAGAHVAEFFKRFLRHSQGRFKGRPFELLPWQRDMVDRLYGWKRPDGFRRFRECYLEVPKKNGKSTLTAGLELYHLVADGENGPELYTGALDRKQAAKTIFKEVASMVRSSPDLQRRLDVIDYSKRVAYPAENGSLEVLSADAPNKEGFNASFTCIDELHVQPTPVLYHTLRYAGAAREQPLFFGVTTAGEDRESICYRIHETARQILEGITSDTTFLGLIFAAQEGDDYESPEVWRKANPSLGHTIKEEDFGRECKAAQRCDSDWRSWLRYRLNLWISALARFLARPRWDACAAPTPLSELVGHPCHCGLDLASTTDLAAFAALFADGTAAIHYWTPEATLDERARRDRVDYRGWVRAGLITATSGNVIDYDRIKADVLAFHSRHPIAMLHCDPWNATQLATQLTGEGIPLEYLRQGFASLSGPTKELERMVLDGTLRHGGNPVTNWQADNAVVEMDSNENKKLNKRSSRQRIDGLAALVNAVAASMAGGGPAESGESPLVLL